MSFRNYLLFFRFFKCPKFYSQSIPHIYLFVYLLRWSESPEEAPLEEESEAPRAFVFLLCAAHMSAHIPLVCHGHSRPIVSLEYSKETPDGTFLVSSSKDGKPMLRDATTGDWIGTFEGHRGACWDATLNDPATHCATASADFSAKLFNAITGDCLHTFAHKHIVKTVCFSQCGTKLITGGSEKVIRIFDLRKLELDSSSNDNSTSTQTMTQPASELTGAPSQIKTARYICNDELILSSCSDNPDLRVWDARTGIIATTLKTENAVTSIEISEDGKYITTADGKNVTLWDVGSFRPMETWKMKYNMESASVCMKEGKFVCGGEDMWVHLHDCANGGEIGEPGKGHHGPVHCVQFAPDGKSYSSGSEDGTIRIWQTPTNK